MSCILIFLNLGTNRALTLREMWRLSQRL